MTKLVLWMAVFNTISAKLLSEKPVFHLRKFYLSNAVSADLLNLSSKFSIPFCSKFSRLGRYFGWFGLCDALLQPLQATVSCREFKSLALKGLN